MSANIVEFPTVQTLPAEGPPASGKEVSNRLWKAVRYAAALHACAISSAQVLGYTVSQWETRSNIQTMLEMLEAADQKWEHIRSLA